MERTSPFSNQNQSKTSEELVRKKLYAAASAYASYLFTKGHTLGTVSAHIPKDALPSLVTLIENLDEFGECKSFLTNDQETLQKCIDEYHFKGDLLGGIWDYTVWRYKPEKIKEFTKGLEALAKGGKQVIEDLYNRYQQYKTTPIPQEDIEPGVFGIMPETIAIKSLIYRYLENPESYGKQLSKYLGEKLLEARVEERKEVKTYDKLWNTINSYAGYLCSKAAALDVVLEHIPEDLKLVVKLIEKLEEWGGYKSPLTINQEDLEKYADKYYFMSYFLTIIRDWWPSNQEHTPEEIKGFTEGLEFLAEKGKKIIDGLYKLYKEVYDLSLKGISKGEPTIPPYKKGEACVYASTTIWKILMNYFSNPKKYEDQLMKYAGMKPLDWLDRAICNLYGGCKTEKQNT
jgi:hypothetical protein